MERLPRRLTRQRLPMATLRPTASSVMPTMRTSRPALAGSGLASRRFAPRRASASAISIIVVAQHLAGLDRFGAGFGQHLRRNLAITQLDAVVDQAVLGSDLAAADIETGVRLQLPAGWPLGVLAHALELPGVQHHGDIALANRQFAHRTPYQRNQILGRYRRLALQHRACDIEREPRQSGFNFSVLRSDGIEQLLHDRTQFGDFLGQFGAGDSAPFVQALRVPRETSFLVAVREAFAMGLRGIFIVLARLLRTGADTVADLAAGL